MGMQHAHMLTKPHKDTHTHHSRMQHTHTQLHTSMHPVDVSQTVHATPSTTQRRWYSPCTMQRAPNVTTINAATGTADASHVLAR